MARCPKLEVKDTGWFSYDYICTVVHKEIGNDRDKTKIKYLCDPDAGGYEYEKCPIYKNR